MADADQHRRWNHNLHYHRLVLEHVPDGARSALDVGTGNGLLAADLREVVPEVVAIDADADALAAAAGEVAGVEWICGDVMDYPFGRTFDVVASVATLHHLPDPAAALRRFSGLVAPGGVLVVVGLARSSTITDFACDAAGAVAHRWLQRHNGYWEHSAPIASPSHTYAQLRTCADAVMPDATFKRLPLFRYAVIWRNGGLIS